MKTVRRSGCFDSESGNRKEPCLAASTDLKHTPLFRDDATTQRRRHPTLLRVDDWDKRKGTAQRAAPLLQNHFRSMSFMTNAAAKLLAKPTRNAVVIAFSFCR